MNVSYSRKRIIKGAKSPFTEFRWFDPYIFETVLTENNYLVRKIGTNKAPVLHRMRMRQFTHHQTLTDKRITPRKWKPDPEVSLKLDDLYARAWEFEYEKPIFDAENNNATPTNPPEIPVQSDISTEEMRNIPITAHECSPEIFHQTAELSDVTDTYPHTEPDVETSLEQQNSSPTNPAVPNTIYVITRNPILMTTTDITL